MSYQRPKWKSYTLPSVEQVHILRDPPKSIHTRKKERVDISDVLYMVRNDDSRINEGVQYLARGTNPMVDVSYNNTGGGSATTSFQSVQASNPYKVIKDGAFRPPQFRQEDLLPLSRMRRDQPAATTNPGAPDATHDVSRKVDTRQIARVTAKATAHVATVQPTVRMRFDVPEEILDKKAVAEQRLNLSVASAASNPYHVVEPDTREFTRLHRDPMWTTVAAAASTNRTGAAAEAGRGSDDATNYVKDVLRGHVPADFKIVVFDPETRNFQDVRANIKDRMHILVETSKRLPINLQRSNGTPMKLKDYRWKMVATNAGRALVIETDNPLVRMELQKNTPLHSAYSGVGGGQTKDARIADAFTSKAFAEPVHASARTNARMAAGRTDALHDFERDVTLNRTAYHGGFENAGVVNLFPGARALPTLRDRPAAVGSVARPALVANARPTTALTGDFF